jgi:hypothetical protein
MCIKLTAKLELLPGLTDNPELRESSTHISFGPHNHLHSLHPALCPTATTLYQGQYSWFMGFRPKALASDKPNSRSNNIGPS